ncbi:arylsulfatase [Nocardia pneumoniae]|uniref:arylsulfatase n=1 Tax=Nocardia pneumoniae TaxID=228601 RepID=UPI0002DF92DE|nr:arylsulfatase [Nocardia pneumoniae]
MSGSVRSATNAVADIVACDGRPPNIVIILADDLGYGEIGAGQVRIETPNLDRLAAEGIRFTDCYAGAPFCAPSRACLLTGLHTGHGPHRGGTIESDLRPGDITIGDVLRAAGYTTGVFGKWGFGPLTGQLGLEPASGSSDSPSHPVRRGFDEFFGQLSHAHANRKYPDYLWENFDRYDIPANRDDGRAIFAPDLINQRGLDFIERHRGRPFFLYLSHNLPHAPHQPPSARPYEDRPWSPLEKAWAASITRLDHYVGQVSATLERFGLAEDTIILFTSDNGARSCLTDELICRGEHKDESFRINGPFRGGKGTLYEGGLRVPAIVWSPALTEPSRRGTVVDAPWTFWDLLPTVADVAGIAPPDDVDGISVLRTWFGQHQPDSHDYLFFFNSTLGEGTWPTGQGHLARMGQAIRRGHWKALRFCEPGIGELAPLVHHIPDHAWTTELYDLHADPGETRNIAAQHPELVAELIALMKKAWQPPTETPLRVPWTPMCRRG